MAAPFVYTEATRQMSLGLLDFTNNTSIDVRSILVMSNTDADTLDSANFVGDFALDEYNGSTRYDHATVSQTEVVGSNRTEIDLDDAVYTSLAAGTRQAVGIVVIWHKTNDADSIPLFYFNLTPFDGNGSNVTIQFDAAGVMQITSAGA